MTFLLVKAHWQNNNYTNDTQVDLLGSIDMNSKDAILGKVSVPAILNPENPGGDDDEEEEAEEEAEEEEDPEMEPEELVMDEGPDASMAVATPPRSASAASSPTGIACKEPETAKFFRNMQRALALPTAPTPKELVIDVKMEDSQGNLVDRAIFVKAYFCSNWIASCIIYGIYYGKTNA